MAEGPKSQGYGLVIAYIEDDELRGLVAASIISDMWGADMMRRAQANTAHSASMFAETHLNHGSLAHTAHRQGLSASYCELRARLLQAVVDLKPGEELRVMRQRKGKAA